MRQRILLLACALYAFGADAVLAKPAAKAATKPAAKAKAAVKPAAKAKAAAKPAAKAKAAAKPAAKAKAAAKPAAKAKAAAKPAAKAAHPDSKYSYALGYNFGSQIGKSLKRGKIFFDPKALLKGVKEGLAGKGGMSRFQVRLLLMQLRRKFQANMRRSRAGRFKGNLAKGKVFLAMNAKKPGVKVLPSGLQYKVIKAGTGAKPKATDRVMTHYRGTLINGTVFDSSYKRGRPATFAVNGVIRGWTEALQLMKVGAKWKLFIPYNLAYGTRGAGPKIGPYSTLIFDIELIKIVK